MHGTPYAWTGSSRSFRQNETSDERDALFVALQYRPSDKWDINLDAQISDRTQAESRHDLIFLQKRVTPGVTGKPCHKQCWWYSALGGSRPYRICR